MPNTHDFPLVDIGANLSHESFSSDLDNILDDARGVGVTQIIVTGTSVDASIAAASLSAQYPGFLYSTAGIHPHEAAGYSDEARTSLREIATQDNVKAIGETGLDYFRDFSPRPRQREAFAGQLALATELDMPVFLHQRDGHADFIAILREYRDALPKGVVHCFTGTEGELKDYLDLDMHIGITGWICDERRGHHLHEFIKLIPQDRLMLETDAPYLLPRNIQPKPSSRRNVPANITYVLQTVARCLGKDEKSIAEQTTSNARDFFNL